MYSETYIIHKDIWEIVIVYHPLSPNASSYQTNRATPRLTALGGRSPAGGLALLQDRPETG